MNQVTQKEFKLSDEMVIVSTTDLNGTILHCNDSFLKAAGLTRNEVIGKAHNILRHPDVPAAVFRDMWQTLQCGKPWSQVVKNKRKNGDHYWVKAFATPLKQGQKITGYMSVRFPAKRDEINQAVEAYRLIEQGRLMLLRGKPHSVLNSLSRWFSSKNVFQWSGLAAVLSAGFGLFSSPDLVYPFVLGFLVLSVFSGYRWRFVYKSEVQQIQHKLVDLANGYVRQDFTLGTGSLLDTLSECLQPAVVRLGWMAQEAKEAKAQSDAVLQALDSATSCIMLADAAYQISYVNRSLLEMLGENEACFKTVLPHFQVNSVKGSNIDIFHTHPEEIRARLDQIKTRMVTELHIGGLSFLLIITPIRLNNKRCSTMVEWRDITQEVHIENQLKSVIEDISHGQFKPMAVNSQAKGFYQHLQSGVNRVIETLHSAITDITCVVRAQSQGDLTQTITRHYRGDLSDLTQAINLSTDKLSQVVSEVREVAYQVNLEAEEVSNDAQELSSRVQQQASALEQTAATMTQMNHVVRHNSQNALETETVALQVEQDIYQSQLVMQDAIAAMGEIQDFSHKIADIVGLIDSIAFQTNLLALNAAVEAARAGDHGRGFAVVASEVRGLAQKSADAAKDIRELIKQSVKKIERGSRVAGQAGEALSQVTLSVHQVTEMVQQIALASNQQAEGIAQVYQAINSIDRISQENAGLVERATRASLGLSEQASSLNQSIAFFETNKTKSRLIK
ncbi:methyl-accepting chemotaxis protein [Thiomicrospira microaerophila]|uniref:methyl-accepting chemotaxis protein n=1 Tax=Thiomicrospira microaerophila TaxID=406020 RepID=UPI0005C8A982|nr:methyl-accepting chemotaxis protein [Thiomicrospira microaerophila]